MLFYYLSHEAAANNEKSVVSVPTNPRINKRKNGSMADTPKMFDLAKIRTTELLKQTVDFLVDKYKQSRKLFTVASPFGQVIFVLQNIANLIFYYIEDAITELNIKQATRRNSVIGLAGLGGYEPSRALASTGEIKLYVNTNTMQDLPSNIVIIPNYSRITCVNNSLDYMIILPSDDLKISLTDQNVIPPIVIKQGRIEAQQFTGKGDNYESFNVRFAQMALIDHFFVNMYVNDVKWTKYESLLHMPKGAPGFIVRTSPTGLDLFTGTENFGQKVPLGAKVRIEYLVTDGFAGKISGHEPDQILFTFSDRGFNTIGEDIDLNEIISIKTTVIPEYGSNPESIALTRMMLSKTLPTLTTPSAYDLMLRRMQAFSIIRTYMDPNDERMVCLFLVPDVSKLLMKNETYFSIPEDRFIMSATRKEQLLKYIEMAGIKLIATDVKIIDPVISRYVINVSIIVFENNSIDVIKNDIYVALSNYFLSTNRTGRIPRSDLIKLIENINGVDSVNVNIVSENNEAVKKINQYANDICVDEFNDIIMNDNELPIMRGGWTDRYGNYYDKGLSSENLGAVNIQVRSTTHDQKIIQDMSKKAEQQKFMIK